MSVLLNSSVPRANRLQPRPWGRIVERARSKSLNADGSRRAAPFVAITAIAAVVVSIALTHGDPTLSSRDVTLALTLAALGLGSELLSFNQTKEAAGSIALIPLSAMALVAPSSLSIAVLLILELIVQSIHKRAFLKATFNLAQISLGFSTGILAYRWAGGVPFLSLAGGSFVSCLIAEIVPTTLLVAAVLFVNSLTVSGVISLSSRKPLLEVWSTHTKTTLPLSFLLVLVSFYLTWLSVNLGLLGTAGMAIPIIAVRQLYRTTVELSNVTEELLDLMVAAIEARDPYTSGHSQRVANASQIIARALGLGANEIERVTVAALLHDVGKIDEQFAPILAKEGRLTAEEWAIMKRHPIRGAELVNLLSSLRDIVGPVRHHHENWDGTGYPDGLREEQIPLASRIIMFADTLDAITTDRPYRKALTMAEARTEFVKFRGRQFDPSICEIVLSPEVWEQLYRATEKTSVPLAVVAAV